MGKKNTPQNLNNTVINDAKIINTPILSKFKQESPYILLSLIIGVLFTFYLCGTTIINPSEINYLPNRDLNMLFQTWTLFRNDSWQWPIWYNQNVVYPLGTYMEMPLLMAFLKLLSPILPKVFVYNGYLAIVNNILQFYIGFCLFRTLCRDKIIAILGGLFMLGASFYVWRFLAHITLTYQWMLLLAILLCIKPPKITYKTDFYYFLILLFFSIGIAQPYIPVMIYAIGIGQIFKLVYEKFGRFNLFQIGFMLFLLTLIFFAGFYFFSYFSLGNTRGTGFGQNQTPVLGFFYPVFNTLFASGWTLASSFERYEGECYLGLGVILLTIAMLILYPRLLIKNLAMKKYMVLNIIIILMFVYSLSNVVLLTIHTPLFIIPMPDIDFIQNICGALQSSGRFSWILGYAIIISSIVLFYEYMQQRKRLAYLILSLLLVLQILDLSKLYNLVHQDYFMKNANNLPWNYDLHDKFWNELDGKYQHLLVIDVDHEKFSYLAALNHMSINMFYLPRYNQDVRNLEQQQINGFLQNKLEDNSLYIVSQRAYNARTVYADQSQCRAIDSYIVCAKKWVN